MPLAHKFYIFGKRYCFHNYTLQGAVLILYFKGIKNCCYLHITPDEYKIGLYGYADNTGNKHGNMPYARGNETIILTTPGLIILDLM